MNVFFLQFFRGKGDRPPVRLIAADNHTLPSLPLTHMKTHTQIYLTHHLPPKGFIHSVRLYPALTPVHASEEERGARATKDSGKHEKGEKDRKWRLDVERGRMDTRGWICGGLIMTGMPRGERVQHNSLCH